MPLLPQRTTGNHGRAIEPPHCLIPEIDPGGKTALQGWSMPLHVLREIMHAPPDQLAVWQAIADYAPDIRSGDFLFVDRSQRIVKQPFYWLTKFPDVGVIVLKAKTRTSKGRVVLDLASADHGTVVPAKRNQHVIGRVIKILTSI
jgi:hypothetical protein